MVWVRVGRHLLFMLCCRADCTVNMNCSWSPVLRKLHEQNYFSFDLIPHTRTMVNQFGLQLIQTWFSLVCLIFICNINVIQLSRLNNGQVEYHNGKCSTSLPTDYLSLNLYSNALLLSRIWSHSQTYWPLQLA